jgi:DNA ligase-4
MFRRCVVRFLSDDKIEESEPSTDLLIAKSRFSFGGGRIAEDDEDGEISHYVVVGEHPELVRSLREMISRSNKRLPRIVRLEWLLESWFEKTLLDEERYVVQVLR